MSPRKGQSSPARAAGDPLAAARDSIPPLPVGLARYPENQLAALALACCGPVVCGISPVPDNRPRCLEAMRCPIGRIWVYMRTIYEVKSCRPWARRDFLPSIITDLGEGFQNQLKNNRILSAGFKGGTRRNLRQAFGRRTGPRAGGIVWNNFTVTGINCTPAANSEDNRIHKAF